MRRSTLLKCTVTAAAALAVAAPLAAPVVAAKTRAWVVTELKSPAEWPITYPNSVNRRGTIIGFRQDPAVAGSNHAILWKDAASDPVDLPELPGATSSWAGTINDRGQACGNSGGHAVLWDKDGVLTDLHETLTEFKSSVAWDVNRRGDAVGRGVRTADSTVRGIVWPRKGAAVVLPFDATVFQFTSGSGLNDRGTVCGYAGLLPAGKPYHAVYWPKGGDMVDLAPKVKEALPAIVGSVALQVLENGVIFGVAWEPFTGDVSAQKPWIYDPRVGSVALIDTGGAAVATVWGHAGEKTLLGYLDADWIFDQGIGATRCAVWERKKEHRQTTWTLTTVPAPAGFKGLSPVTGNDRGDFVAIGTADDDSHKAFVVSR